MQSTRSLSWLPLLPLLVDALSSTVARRPVLSRPVVAPSTPSVAGDAPFERAVRLCEARVADCSQSITHVPSLLREAFEADFDWLLAENDNRIVHNLTCLQPLEGADGSRLFDDALRQLPLRPGRACVDGACCEACSRSLWTRMATAGECDTLLARADALMAPADTHPHHNMYLMSCAASGDVRTTLSFVRLVERMRRAIAYEYGLPLAALHPWTAFVSRLHAPGAEPQSLHADESSCARFHYSSVLYLSSQGEAFEGGGIAFAEPPWQLRPVAGSALCFSSGWENMHQVGPLDAGCRHAIPAFFGTSREASDAAGAAAEEGRGEDPAEALWRTALMPESEEAFREFMRRWHGLLASESP